MRERMTLKQCVIGNILVVIVGFERRRFEKRCRDIEHTQEKLLLEIIKRNRLSDFGKRHGFSKIESISDFQEALPLTNYEYFRPYVNRVLKGDERALFGPREKVIRFATTSGTTGQPKYIPVTKTFVKRYWNGWKLWGSYVYLDYPKFYTRRIMYSASSLTEEKTESGIPCGAISGLIADMQTSVLKENYALPPAINKVKDVALKLYLGMRIAIPQKVRFFMTANPNTVLQHVQTADERREDIIRDIADGTCKGIEELGSEARKALLPYITKDIKKARRLEGCVKQSGRLYPRDYWPELDFLACWTGGPLKMYVNRLSRYFGNVAIRDIGLMATEGRMTIPTDDGTSAGPLDIENNFFEFVPEEMINDPSPTVLLPHQLEKGKKYFIILTTWAGLYRYDISDVVEVTGFLHNNPVVRYLNKGGHFSNVIGEKLSEYQAVSAMEMVIKKLRLDIDNFCLALSINGGPYYSILVEKDKITEDGIARKFISEYDKALRSLNISYHRRRSARRIKPASLRLVAPHSFDKLDEQLRKERGVGFDQFKHNHLITDEKILEKFQVLDEKFLEE